MIDTRTYFNPNGVEVLNEKLWEPLDVHPDNKPTGFIDFNRSKYSWATKLYDLMVECFWTMGEVNTSAEKKAFKLLEPNEQEIYKYTFGQLSFNDSIQSLYLVDLQQKANNNIVRATMIKQAETEILHSKAYATLLDACGNSNEVFDLYKHDHALAEKNERIADMFARHINFESSEDMLMSSMASVCLEGVFFLTGFSFIYTLGDKVQGARDTISFIQRDENVHLAMFANIVKVLRRENKFSNKVVEKMQNMLREATHIELMYAKYLTDKFPILGLSYDEVETTVHNYANERCVAVDIPKIYKTEPKTYLQKLVDKGSNLNSVKSNFFESNVKSYAKDTISMDDF